LIQDPGGKSEIIYKAGLLPVLVAAAYFVFRSHS
jgi:hypothetical protein